MARPVKKLAPEDAWDAYSYFENACRELSVEARIAFKALPKPEYFTAETRSQDYAKSRNQEPTKALQQWIDEHAKHKWSFFLAQQRQKNLVRRERIRKVNLHEKAWLLLRDYAKTMNLSLSDAVAKLADEATKKMMEEELGKKEKRSHKRGL